MLGKYSGSVGYSYGLSPPEGVIPARDAGSSFYYGFLDPSVWALG
ncbi:MULTISPECIES: hypothetical protein [Wolbachia]|nr:MULTISPECIES: hypothetical protein [Wolbachia]